MLLSEAFNNAMRGDEFYTRYSGIAKEIGKYNLAGMVVYCNCDNPETSQFVRYFKDNFDASGIKGLMATFNGPNPFLYEYDGVNEKKTPISSGLFQDNIGLLRKCDIVVTNPPFSSTMALKLIQLLIENNKKFIIVGPLILMGKGPIFNYVKNGQLYVSGSIRGFDRPEGNDGSDNKAFWWTNMEVPKPNFTPSARYDERLYPKYDNFDAIDSKTNDIPCDYPGYIGVPISFVLKYDPSKFELIQLLDRPKINGKNLMPRIIIRNRNMSEGIKRVRITEQALKNAIKTVLVESRFSVLYHKSPSSCRKSILKNGLIPSVGDSYKAHWDHRDDLTPYVFLYDHNTIKDGEYDSTYDDDIYSIDTKQLDLKHLKKDPDSGMRGCFVYDSIIPASAIKLVYKGSKKDSGDLSRHLDIYA